MLNLKQPGQALIYLRVSSDIQVENYSLDTQEEICNREAQRRGLLVLSVYREEGIPAKTIYERPELIEMLEFCRKNKNDISAVIVYKIDRLSREATNFLIIRQKLRELGIDFLSASEPTGDSPAEKYTELVLAGAAQMDNEIRAERSRNGMRARFQSGLPSSSVPLGYFIEDGYPYKDAITFEKVLEAWQIMATGTVSLSQLSDVMVRKGLTRNNQPIRPQTWSRLFRNRFYVGKVVSHKYRQEVQGQHPAMISEEQFNHVQEVLEGRNVRLDVPTAVRQRYNEDFPLRRIVRCSYCGRPFTGAWSKGKSRKFAYYFCQKRCGEYTSVPKDLVHERVVRVLSKIRLTKEAAEFLTESIRVAYVTRTVLLQKHRKEAVNQLNRLSEARQVLINKHLAGTYTDEVYTEQNNQLNEKITAVQGQVSKDTALLERYTVEYAVAYVNYKLQNLGQIFTNCDAEQIRLLFASLFPQGLTWDYPGIQHTKISLFYNYR